MPAYVSGTSALRSRSAVASYRYCCLVHKAVVASRAAWSDSAHLLGIVVWRPPRSFPIQGSSDSLLFFPSPVTFSSGMWSRGTSQR